MKKYYFKNKKNKQYSNDPQIQNATPISSVYYCNEVVNKKGNCSYDGGPMPWFCVKDGTMYLTSGFKSENNVVTAGPSSGFYRRIFSHTIDCMTYAWKMTSKETDTSWISIRTLPQMYKKELYFENDPIVNVMDIRDKDGNPIGDKLTWKTSTSNFKFMPINHQITNTNRWYIRLNEKFYNGDASIYENKWSEYYHNKTIFLTKDDAEDMANQMQLPGVAVEPTNYDESTSAWNFNYCYKGYTLKGFIGWSEQSNTSDMFTTYNYNSIYYRPTHKTNFDYDITDTYTEGLVENNDSSAFEVNSCITAGGAAPSYFTLDITKVPTTYNKIDVVIDSLFYYPTNNYINAQSYIAEDYSNVFAVYNYGHSPGNQTVNCWSYLYKPDTNKEWKYATKYMLSAKKPAGEVYINVYYSADMNSPYTTDGWSYFTEPSEALRINETEIQDFINRYATEIAADTTEYGIIAGFNNIPYPSADYLGNSFFGNIKYDPSIKSGIKTSWYNDENTKYTWKNYLLYDNSDVDYDLEDPKLYDKLYVYCINNNNSDICKWKIDWGEGREDTGYALWSDISGCKDCTNFYITAYSADNTEGFDKMNGVNFTTALFSDPDAPRDYRKYFDADGEVSRRYLNEMTTQNWQTISSDFLFYGYRNSYYGSNVDYLHESSPTKASIYSIATYMERDIPQKILYNKNTKRGEWNKQGFKLKQVMQYNMQNVTMKHQIDLGDRTDTSGFTFGDNTKDYRYLHISYPGTNTLSNNNKYGNHLTQVDMYYKFTN